MDRVELENRTKQLALRILKLARVLMKDVLGREVGRQLLRSGMSVAANYRAAGRARSKAEFIAKLGVVEEEADETVFWLEMIVDGDLMEEKRVASLLTEAQEILAIIVASKKTARARKTEQ